MKKENAAVEVVETVESTFTPLVATGKMKRPEAAKIETFNKIGKALEDAGIKVSNGSDYEGFTATTLVVNLEDLDIQVKIISPSAKAIKEQGGRYSKVAE